MDQVIKVLITVIFVILGGVPSLYIFFSIPAILLWKIYRQVKHSIPIMQ